LGSLFAGRVAVIVLILLVASIPAYGGQGTGPAPFINEVIFEAGEAGIKAPRAVHTPEAAPVTPAEKKAGWRASNDGDYFGFDAGSVFSSDEGTIEVKLTVLDTAGLKALGRNIEALVTLYDDAGVPFFAIGINSHDIMVGSYPLHPMVMETAFGGVGFPYVAKLDGPLKEGTEVAVTVTWGPEPRDDKVFVNGKLIETAVRRGPRHSGNPPGFEPTATFISFLNGFTTFDNRHVGPPATLTVGRIGTDGRKGPYDMFPPRSIAIKQVRLSNKRQDSSAR